MPEKVFCSIKEACAQTGLSQYYLRRGCRAGTIPHVVVGSKYMVNLPLLRQRLDRESEGSSEDA